MGLKFWLRSTPGLSLTSREHSSENIQIQSKKMGGNGYALIRGVHPQNLNWNSIGNMMNQCIKLPKNI
ncbi:hypothetical protein DRJ19_05515, partial [Candidatus Woesearchaeota archaeon]